MMKSPILILLLLLSLVALPLLPQSAEHIAAVEQWHASRIAGLKKDHSWLSLIALEWMKEGENRIPSVGIVRIAGDSVWLQLSGGVTGTLNGKPFTSGKVQADKDKVMFGSKAVAVIARGGRYAMRVWDSETPAKKNFTGIDRYPVAPQWKIVARWEPYAVPKKIDVPTVIEGLVQEGVAPGQAVFTIDGKEYRLEPTIEEGSSELFFVFGDRTNGRETYGAGRFLYAGPPKDGTVVLDFNLAYNPPCVFSDFATCPVPTPENRLKVRIEAGEKKYSHH